MLRFDDGLLITISPKVVAPGFVVVKNVSDVGWVNVELVVYNVDRMHVDLLINSDYVVPKFFGGCVGKSIRLVE